MSPSARGSPVRCAALGGALAAAGALALGGCEERSEQAPAATSSARARLLGSDEAVHEVGELGHARDYAMSVEGVEPCAMRAPFLPSRGNEVIGIEVTLEGETDHEVPVNPFYAILIDGDGNRYRSTLAGCEPGLKARRVTKGEKATGFVSFEIPKRAHDLELHYAPVVIGGGREELRFKLPR